MAAHAMRYPRRRRWPKRMLGLLATAAFLGSGVLIASWVIPKDEPAAPARRAEGGASTEGGHGRTRAAGRGRAKKEAGEGQPRAHQGADQAAQGRRRQAHRGRL